MGYVMRKAFSVWELCLVIFFAVALIFVISVVSGEESAKATPADKTEAIRFCKDVKRYLQNNPDQSTYASAASCLWNYPELEKRYRIQVNPNRTALIDFEDRISGPEDHILIILHNKSWIKSDSNMMLIEDSGCVLSSYWSPEQLREIAPWYPKVAEIIK